VVSQRDEPEAETPQLHDFLHHAIDAALPRLLTVGAPHRTERAVLRTTAHRLHGRPHIAALGQQVPASRNKFVATNAAAVVNFPGPARHTVANDVLPNEVAVAFHDRMGGAVLMRLFWKQRRVNSAVHDPGAALARQPSDFVSAPRISSVDADANH